MWCQNCGKERSHYHVMGSAKAKCCQRCRGRQTTTATYCTFCGVNRLCESDICDVHYGNTLSTPASPTDDYSPPPTSSGSEEGGYHTDLSSPVLSPAPSSSTRSDDSLSPSPSPSPSPPLASSPVRSTSPAQSIYDREQCRYCKLWFDNESECDDHQLENGSHCRKHGVCFPVSDNYEHARRASHESCFVPGCDDDGFMLDEEVVEHVWEEHTERG